MQEVEKVMECELSSKYGGKFLRFPKPPKVSWRRMTILKAQDLVERHRLKP